MKIQWQVRRDWGSGAYSLGYFESEAMAWAFCMSIGHVLDNVIVSPVDVGGLNAATERVTLLEKTLASLCDDIELDRSPYEMVGVARERLGAEYPSPDPTHLEARDE